MGGSDRAARLRGLVVGPDGLATAMYERLERLEGGGERRVTLGVDSLDTYLVPLWDKAFVIVAARTRNGKSTLIKHLARRELRRLAGLPGGGEEEGAVIYVTAEEPVDVIGGDLRGWPARDDVIAGRPDVLARLRRDTFRVPEWPLWMIRQPTYADESRARLTAEALGPAISQLIEDQGIRPTLVLVDYAQKLRSAEAVDSERQNVIRVSAACDDLATSQRCPVVLAAQAGRQTTGRPLEMPTLEDIQESDRLAQDADVVLGLSFPVGGWSKAPEDWVTVNGLRYEAEGLLLVRVLKQRRGPTGRLVPLVVDRWEMTLVEALPG